MEACFAGVRARLQRRDGRATKPDDDRRARVAGCERELGLASSRLLGTMLPGVLLAIFSLLASCAPDASRGSAGWGLRWPASAELPARVLRVDLLLPEPMPPGDVGRLALATLDRAAHRLPESRAVVGSAATGRGTLRIALASGADAETAAARLELDLAGARDVLPPGSLLNVAVEDPPLPIALRLFVPADWTDAAVRDLADRLAALPGTAGVNLAPAAVGGLEIALHAPDASLASEVRSALVDLASTPAATAAAEPSLLLARSGELVKGVQGVLAGSAGAADGRAPAVASRPLPRLTAPALGAALARLEIPLAGGALQLAGLADLRAVREAPAFSTRVGGRSGAVITLQRSPSTAPWALGNSIDAVLRTPPGTSAPIRLDDEAALWRGLLARGTLAALLACLLSGLVVARARRRSRGASAGSLTAETVAVSCASLGLLVAALATELLVARGIGLPATPETCVLAAVATLFALPWALAAGAPSLRTALLLLAGPGCALAVAFGLGGQLIDRVALPLVAATTATAVALSVQALALFAARSAGARAPAPRAHAPVAPLPLRAAGRDAASRALRASLRDPGAALLAATALAAAAFVLVGPALRPSAGQRAVKHDLAVHLDLPATATPALASERAAALERAVAPLDGIARTETTLTPGSVDLGIDLVAGVRRGAAAERLLARLRTRLPFGEARLGIADAALPLSDLLEPLAREGPDARPASPWTAETYGVVLRAASSAELEQAYAAVRRSLRQFLRASALHPAWGALTPQLVLVPRAGAAAGPGDGMGSARTLAAALRARTVREAPAFETQEIAVRIVPPGTPRTASDIPQRTAVLGRPIPSGLGARSGAAPAMVVTSAVATEQEELVPARLLRRDGRFELPLSIDVPGSTERVRRIVRSEVDAAIAALRVPGVEIERPSLARVTLDPRSARLGAGAAVLVAVWVALALLLAGLVRRPGAVLRRGALLAIPLLSTLAVMAVTLAVAGETADERQWIAAALGAAAGLTLCLEPLTRGAAGTSLLRERLRSVPLVQVLVGQAAVLVLCTLAAPAPLADVLRPARLAAFTATGSTLAAFLLVAGLAVSTTQRDAARRRARAGARETWSAGALVARTRLEVNNLTKSYGTFRALSRVSFELAPGITGLLGPNGAGKTTLLRLLVGLLEPTRGTVRLDGVTLAPATLDLYRRRLGFLPQDFNAYPGFSAEDFLRHWARTRELAFAHGESAEIAQLLDAVGLSAHAARRVRDFSGGMRRRLGIAVALLGAPPLLIVDEPTTGLDLPSRQQLREILLRAAAQRIVLLSTHIASDVEAVASRLLVLQRGRLVFDGSVEALLARARGRVHETLLSDEALLEFSRHHRITRRVRQLDGVRVRAVSPHGAAPAGDGRGWETVEPNLEEAYLAAMDGDATA